MNLTGKCIGVYTCHKYQDIKQWPQEMVKAASVLGLATAIPLPSPPYLKPSSKAVFVLVLTRVRALSREGDGK